MDWQSEQLCLQCIHPMCYMLAVSSTTAENHTFPWCFATYNGAVEHTESCHTLVHYFVSLFFFSMN